MGTEPISGASGCPHLPPRLRVRARGTHVLAPQTVLACGPAELRHDAPAAPAPSYKQLSQPSISGREKLRVP